MNIEIKAYDKLPEDSKSIREEVFVVEQGFTEEFDTVDNRAIHFVAYDDLGSQMGTCRIFTEESEKIYYLGRLAVLKKFRKMNIGRSLLTFAEATARSKGADQIRLHSQLRAMQFYRKCGYEEYGAIELDEGCPHIWMKKNL